MGYFKELDTAALNGEYVFQHRYTARWTCSRCCQDSRKKRNLRHIRECKPWTEKEMLTMRHGGVNVLP